MKLVIIPSAELPTSLHLPCFASRVRAGFPSPADDYIDKKLDLNELLIKHPAASFYCWAEGESMEGVGIYSGDLLVVDRSVEPRDGDVVAAISGDLTCKQLDLVSQTLRSAHPSFPPFKIEEGIGVEIEGVVISSIRFHRARTR